MELFPMGKPSFKSYIRIGNIIPQHALTLLTALPGCGKSFTLLKFLNKHGITPLYFNLDEDPSLLAFESNMTSDIEVLRKVFKGHFSDLQDQVIVIDTYQRLQELLDIPYTKEGQEAITKVLMNLCKDIKCTLIVVGHPQDFVGKSSIFTDNPSLVRNCHEHIHIDKILSTKKGVPPRYCTFINKNRGNGGTAIIEEWMRS